jgi:hypothetical protein
LNEVVAVDFVIAVPSGALVAGAMLGSKPCAIKMVVKLIIPIAILFLMIIKLSLGRVISCFFYLDIPQAIF